MGRLGKEYITYWRMQSASSKRHKTRRERAESVCILLMSSSTVDHSFSGTVLRQRPLPLFMLSVIWKKKWKAKREKRQSTISEGKAAHQEQHKLEGKRPRTPKEGNGTLIQLYYRISRPVSLPPGRVSEPVGPVSRTLLSQPGESPLDSFRHGFCVPRTHSQAF